MEPDRIQLGCAKYRNTYRYNEGGVEKVQTIEMWHCYGNDQGIQAAGHTAAEAIGLAVLEIVECYEGQPFIIDAVTVAKDVIVTPEQRGWDR